MRVEQLSLALLTCHTDIKARTTLYVLHQSSQAELGGEMKRFLNVFLSFIVLWKSSHMYLTQNNPRRNENCLQIEAQACEHFSRRGWMDPDPSIDFYCYVVISKTFRCACFCLGRECRLICLSNWGLWVRLLKVCITPSFECITGSPAGVVTNWSHLNNSIKEITGKYRVCYLWQKMLLSLDGFLELIGCHPRVPESSIEFGGQQCFLTFDMLYFHVICY